MVARSTPPLRDISSDPRPNSDERDAEAHLLDPDSASRPVEPARPSEGPRQQMLALVPSPSRLAMIGGGIAAALCGGAAGYWLGSRRAQRPTRPIRKAARNVDSVMALLPVAAHLL